MKFTYRSKGSADDWTTDVVEAESREQASERLDAIFGVVRDSSGKQINPEVVQVEILADGDKS